MCLCHLHVKFCKFIIHVCQLTAHLLMRWWLTGKVPACLPDNRNNGNMSASFWRLSASCPFPDKLRIALNPAVISCVGLFTVNAQWTCGCASSSPFFISGCVPQLVFVRFSSEPALLSYHNNMPELDALSINSVLSTNHPLAVTLHSSQSLFSACELAALHTEPQTLWHEKHFLYTQWSSLCYEWAMLSCIIIACTVTDNERAIRPLSLTPCWVFPQRSEGMEGIRVGCMSRVGLNRPLEAVTLSFLPGSRHSSSIPYPMSLCFWDKVLFVCPWLLASAHRALKLRLNDGIFISIPPFRACSHPSLLSLCSESHPLTLLTHPPTFCNITNKVLVSSLNILDRQHQFFPNNLNIYLG